MSGTGKPVRERRRIHVPETEPVPPKRIPLPEPTKAPEKEPQKVPERVSS